MNVPVMTESFLLHVVVTAGLWVAEATAVLLGAWLLVRSIKSAALRHVIWRTAFCALILIPALSLFVPPLLLVRTSAPLRVRTVVGAPLQAPPASEGRPVRRYGTPVRLGLLAAWGLGVVVVAGQGVVGLAGLRRLRRQSTESPFAPVVLSTLADLVALNRSWELRVSTTSRPSTAMTWGFFRPVVLLPQDAVRWPLDRLAAVVLHELGHVRRADCATQWLTHFVCALYWFHPLVWQAARALRADAEAAADAMVLDAGMTPSTYATHLLWFAAHARPERSEALALAFGRERPSKLEARICRIVEDSSHSRRNVTWAQTLPAIGIALIATLLFASVRPRISPPRTAAREPLAVFVSTPLLVSTARQSLRPLKPILPPRVIRGLRRHIP